LDQAGRSLITLDWPRPTLSAQCRWPDVPGLSGRCRRHAVVRFIVLPPLCWRGERHWWRTI